MTKYGFKIGVCESGVYCFYQEDTRISCVYLLKNGDIDKYYDGKFFTSFEEAAKFLNDYLDKEYPVKVEVTRREVANALNISRNFVLVD